MLEVACWRRRRRMRKRERDRVREGGREISDGRTAVVERRANDVRRAGGKSLSPLRSLCFFPLYALTQAWLSRIGRVIPSCLVTPSHARVMKFSPHVVTRVSLLDQRWLFQRTRSSQLRLGQFFEPGYSSQYNSEI